MMSPRVYLVTLGCPKNLIDSEILMGRLLEDGYYMTALPQEAEIIIVNTCAFIKDAKEEAIQTIVELASWKRVGSCKKLVVIGCLPQRYGKELAELLPEVDVFAGPGEIPRLTHHLGPLEEKAQRLFLVGPRDYLLEEQGIERPVSPPTAYVRIAEGCSNLCSYCAVPSIRGPLRSRPIESIAREVEGLSKKGVREVVIVAQDTTSFGLDRAERSQLPDLLDTLDALDGISWIRLMYAHPKGIDERLINTMASSKRVCHYLDMPIQHAAAGILERMNRKVGPNELLSKIKMLRDAIPDIWLRTTVIVGFPGETEEDFRELLDFLEKARFQWLGVFTYSREEGTVAAGLPRQVSKRIATRRKRELLTLQRDITQEALAKWLGKRIQVLIDKRGERTLQGRAFFQAPEVDGVVHLPGCKLPLGTFQQIVVKGIKDYDLLGSLPDLS